MKKYFVIAIACLFISKLVLAQKRSVAQALEFFTCQIERKSDLPGPVPAYDRQFVASIPDKELGENYVKSIKLNSRAVIMSFAFDVKGNVVIKIEEPRLKAILKKEEKLDWAKIKEEKNFSFLLSNEFANSRKLEYQIDCQL